MSQQSRLAIFGAVASAAALFYLQGGFNMILNMKCPSCGATMQFDDTQSSMDCPYCGGKVANIAEQVNITQNVNVSGTVVHVQDRSNDPNLFISYNTNNPSVGMVSRIVTTGVKGSYVNGQTLYLRIISRLGSMLLLMEEHRFLLISPTLPLLRQVLLLVQLVRLL